VNDNIIPIRSAAGLPVQIGGAGEIRLLSELDAVVSPRARFARPPQRLCDVFRDLKLGDSVFLEGYTCNQNDQDPRLKYFRTQGYTRNNTIVLTVRSTEEQGIKGVRVYREG
jgi:hypothetical protein